MVYSISALGGAEAAQRRRRGREFDPDSERKPIGTCPAWIRRGLCPHHAASEKVEFAAHKVEEAERDREIYTGEQLRTDLDFARWIDEDAGAYRRYTDVRRDVAMVNYYRGGAGHIEPDLVCCFQYNRDVDRRTWVASDWCFTCDNAGPGWRGGGGGKICAMARVWRHMYARHTRGRGPHSRMSYSITGPLRRRVTRSARAAWDRTTRDANAIVGGDQCTRTAIARALRQFCRVAILGSRATI